MLKYKIAAYLRLSNEDGDGTESQSIKGQRSIIRNFLDKNTEISESSFNEYIDDGYSGTNFERPGFQQMIEKVKSGEIDCIIVKDMSRFGRNYIGMSQYLEQIFPALNVRFISVNDGYDSDKHKGTTAGLEIPFQNLIYDMYSKDISKKVKSSKTAKMKKGECIAAYAIYGYKKSVQNRNVLEIDEPAAAVVKRIFQMNCDGKTPMEIAIILNDEGIPTPSEYKRSLGEKRKWDMRHSTNVWTAPAIRRILTDKRYTGDYIGGKWETTQIGSRKAQKTSQEKWIMVENAIPVIVSKDIFQKSMEMIKARTSKANGRKSTSLFSRKIYCGHCGYTMGRKDCKSHYYYCRTLPYTDKYGCNERHFPEKKLMDIVLEVIRTHARLACDAAKLWQVYEDELQKRIHEQEAELQALLGQKEKLLNGKMELYENFKKLDWSREKYLVEREKLEAEIRASEEKIKEFRKRFDESKERVKGNKQNTFIEKFHKYGGIESLDKRIVEELIDRIDVYSDKHIKVSVKYMDDYKRAIVLL